LNPTLASSPQRSIIRSISSASAFCSFNKRLTSSPQHRDTALNLCVWIGSTSRFTEAYYAPIVCLAETSGHTPYKSYASRPSSFTPCSLQ
jgi:hypothetical protein